MKKSEILDRIISAYGLKSKSQLSRFLGVTPAVINNWYSRDTIDYELIIEKCKDRSIEWILTGRGHALNKELPPYLSEEEYKTLNSILSKVPEYVTIRKPELTALIEYSGEYYKAESIDELEKYANRIRLAVNAKKDKEARKIEKPIE